MRARRGRGRGARRHRQRGTTVLEALLSLLLGLLLVGLVTGLLVRTREAAGLLTIRSDRLTAVRVARSLLERDGPEVGATLSVADSLPVRAHRGTVVFCPEGMGAAGWAVGVRGIRMPDPSKDSVTVLGRDGRWTLHRLAGRTTGIVGCPGLPREARHELWMLDPPPDVPLVGRYFERGSYHLAGRALRYRRGDGGRQPLTPEVLSTPGSGFEPRGDRLQARLRFLPRGKAGAAEAEEWLLPVTGSGGDEGG